MKKICIYVNSLAPAGGIERVIANLFNILAEYYEVTFLTKDNLICFYKISPKIRMISLQSAAGISMNDSKLTRAVRVIKSFFITHRALKKILKQEKFDYIYVAHVSNAMEALFAIDSEKLIISEHGSYYGYNIFYTFLKKIIYPKAYKLIVPSKMDTEIYIKLGYPAIYIPHHQTFPNGRALSDVKRNHTIINVGRYTDDKRQMLLLSIWKDIVKKNEHGDWRLVFIGSGENEEILKRYVLNNNLDDSVIIGTVTTDIAEKYLQAGIFAFTSRFEGFGMVLLEAMSFGLPCISFDCPSGPRDVILDGKNGFLIENGNSCAFMEKLVLLMQNSELRYNFQKNALKTINNWNNKKITNTWKSILV